MFKYLLIIQISVLLTFFGSKVNADSEELFDILSGNGLEISEYIQAQIDEISSAFCDSDREQLNSEKITKEIKSRVGEVFKQNTQSVCKSILNKHEWIVEPFTTEFNKCTSIFGSVPDFVTSAVLSLTKTVCKMEGHQLIELFNPCLLKVELIDTCIPSGNEFGNQFGMNLVLIKNHTLTKEVCTMYKDKKPCIEKKVKSKCKLAETQNSVMEIWDSALKNIC